MKTINISPKTRQIIIVATIIITLFLCIPANKQTDDIYVYYTGDVHCAISENIGYSSLSAYVKKERSEHQYTTLVDLGDFLQDNAKNSNEDGSISSLTKGSAIVDIMNVIEYDIVTIGNHEFDFGLGTLARRVEGLHADITLCNAEYRGSLLNPLDGVEDYVIKEYGNTKVAYIGVTSPDVLYKCDETIIQDKDGNNIFYLYDDDPDKFYSRVQEVIDEVNKKVDYVVILSHLGIDNVDGFSSLDLIKHTYNVDVVLDSHSHSVIENDNYKNKVGRNVVLSATGIGLENFGELILTKEKQIKTTLIKGHEANGEPVIMDDDKAVVKKLQEIHNKVYGISE